LSRIALALVLASAAASAARKESLADEQEKWLEEDVRYI